MTVRLMFEQESGYIKEVIDMLWSQTKIESEFAGPLLQTMPLISLDRSKYFEILKAHHEPSLENTVTWCLALLVYKCSVSSGDWST